MQPDGTIQDRRVPDHPRNLVRFAEATRTHVLSLVWVGTRTAEDTAMVAFFRDVLGRGVQVSEPDFAVLDVPDGATDRASR